MRTTAALIAVLLAGPGAHARDDDLVAFVAYVEQAKGHLLASREAYPGGQRVRAGVHASHPVQELGRRLYGPVQAVDPALASRVRDSLTAASRALDARPSPVEYDTTVRAVEARLDEGVRRVVPPAVLGDPTFEAAVVRRLLLVIEEEYEEAVAEGRVVLEIEYQDAYGFLRRARARWDRMRDGARLPAERRTAVDRAFTELAEAMPGIRPPASPSSPERVASLLKVIDTALASIAGDRR